MMNPTLAWFMLVPLGLGLALWYSLRTVQGGWMPAALNAGIGTIIVLVVFFASRGAATSDIEIWNGQVTSKERVHGTYEKPYDCRCRSVQRCTGSGNTRSCTSDRVCDTCYETRYTVNWSCATTIGGYTIDSADTSSRSVYERPNPARWLSINVGDPVAKTSSYTNYVQAVPESLFTPSSAGLKAKFASLIPAYPDQVYDFYRLNRFLTPGYTTPDAPSWNNDISMMLRELGPRKQVNAIVVIAKTDDPNYEYALRDAWEGVNKNDVVLIIGSKAWPQIDFVRVLTWSKAENFKIELRDSVLALETIQREPIMKLLQEQISKNFVRRKMAEFQYLESEIDPPTWLMITTAIVLLLGAVGTFFGINGTFSRTLRRTSYGRVR